MKAKLLFDIDEVLCFSGYLELVNEFVGTKNPYDYPVYLPFRYKFWL